MFASFELDVAAVLDRARLPVLINPFGGVGDFSLSIWSSPFAAEGPELEALIRKNSYSLSVDSRNYIEFETPAWELKPGSYWLSVFGVNGDSFQWGAISGIGDDRRYLNGDLFEADSGSPASYLLGFSLLGNELVTAPVTAPIGNTLPLLLCGLGLLTVLRRQRTH